MWVINVSVMADSRNGVSAYAGVIRRAEDGQVLYTEAHSFRGRSALKALQAGLDSLETRAEAWPRNQGYMTSCTPIIPFYERCDDIVASNLLEAILPGHRVFGTGGLVLLEPGHYQAHGGGVYDVWTGHGVCSCPAFTFGHSRPCKHLRAALELESEAVLKGAG